MLVSQLASPALTESTLPDVVPDMPAYDAKEPRLIVEALVVRKMSIDEGFLDFGGFSQSSPSDQIYGFVGGSSGTEEGRRVATRRHVIDSLVGYAGWLAGGLTDRTSKAA